MVWTPPKAANRLVRIAAAFSAAHNRPRFPIDVKALALDAGSIFQWSDPISEVKAASIPSFEGALFPDEGRRKWMLLYNDAIRSTGRVRFTQAHELGHYILHREHRQSFECSSDDMLDWSEEEKNLEGQADLFASYLLMPFDDFRDNTNCVCDLNVLGACANRYGVSLQAAILRWLSCTEEKAVILMSRDGFVNWAWSSKRAFECGAFFKTKQSPIELPKDSLAANMAVSADRVGRELAAGIWFPYAEKGLTITEMKVYSELYESTLTLLRLPRYAEVWKPREFVFRSE
ncbi:ImmA/IrrE family metallo-endopeptidase [Hydrocarboniphaga sp.]|uniref:ImmA/IrrE family metallo-endopeptidase n=1 Tax=Hydrocarboniphaga sp. TaxID=2033016 RepID=UPI002AB8A490|nr:ImmA/IrrE family metallo-endopeptidase [Hydrocarboniphaga sp.]MDZ4077624.1 ImmA/IrrE family metallo-endopeptidase [Hydrocarboniphaga sp.]